MVNRWLALGLLVSLGLNVFVGGIVVGRVLNANAGSQAPGTTNAPGFQMTGSLARMAQSVPAENREAFMRAIEPHRASLTAAGQEFREARTRLGEATLAEPFNRAGFIAAANQLDARAQAQRKAFYEALGDGFAVLPAAIRRDLMESRSSGGQRRRPQ